MTSDLNSPKKEYSLSNFRILVVDDYGFMVSLLTGMLREFGVGGVTIAENGREAQDLIRICNSDPSGQGQIDVAIVDWLMPECDGLELLRWIRRQKKDSIRFLPTLLVSAYTSEDVVVAARDNGASEALVKPVAAETLAQRILYMIDHPRPFVKAPDFFGPDRRRRNKNFNHEERRVRSEDDVKVNHERL